MLNPLRTRRPCRLQVIFLLLTTFVFAAASVGVEVIADENTSRQLTGSERTQFENEVRPLLAKHCYECHSAQSKKLLASLRLDHINGILRGGDSGPAVEPGKPDESMLISAIRYEDFEMPPSGKLSDEEIAILERWVTSGARWPEEPEPKPGDGVPAEFDWKQRVEEHWCWTPIGSPSPPEVEDTSWPTNAIDRFILAKLEDAGLTPAGDADRRALARRLYFDLIGLPPTPEQLQRFLKDNRNDAYEQLVDELLDSPHYGEKWTRHWLDLVRYGETLGHEFDYPLHHAYRYRDYVIRALNADVPYDQFVQEHVAGDLLPAPRMHPTEEFNESIIGTGFWFLGEACHSPTDVRQDEADRVDNQIDVFSKTFLGLTVACARCHDHKFDPIPTKDYYALFGYIQSSRRQEALLDPHGTIRGARQKLKQLNAQSEVAWRQVVDQYRIDEHHTRAAMKAEIDSSDESIVQSLKRPSHPLFAMAKLNSLSGDEFVATRNEILDDLRQRAENAQKQLEKTDLCIDFANDDFSDWYFTGEAFRDSATVAGDVQQGPRPFARTGAVHSGLYGKRFQGVLRSPTFVLPKKQIHYKMTSEEARLRLIVDGYTMDEFNALLFKDVEKKSVDTQNECRWVTQSRDLYHYVGHRAHIEIIDHNDGFAAVEQIRFSDDATPIDPPHAANLAVLESNPENLEELYAAYVEVFRNAMAKLKNGNATNDEIEAANWLAKHNLIGSKNNDAIRETEVLASRIEAIDQRTPEPMKVIALADGDAEEEYVFVRGSHKNQGELAPRRLLVAIAGEDQSVDPEHSGRLELAQKLTAADNQLTARVAVNRLWHYLLGSGIVPTVDDFGKMGQPPTHPELLDWLARDFMDAKQWSLKKSIKQIVMSRTYRMASTATASEEQLAILDPENKLLHRAHVRRLTGEAIRDSLLQLSGRLDRKMFGPSIATHLTPFMEGRGRPGRNGPQDGAGRRSLYVEVRRNFLWPMMMTFDRPSPFSTMGRRSVSNVPAQSLMLMNDPFVIDQAKNWSEQIQARESMTDARIRLAFEMAFAVEPTDRQMASCRTFLASSENDAKAWNDLCHMLINSKSFIYLN